MTCDSAAMLPCERNLAEFLYLVRAAPGGGAGAWLLLSTPEHAFGSIEPFLVADGSLACSCSCSPRPR